MSDYNEGEGRAMDVVDKRMEQGISLNNILSFVLVGVMSWVGLNIENIKEQMAKANAMNQVQTVRIDAIESRVTAVERGLAKHSKDDDLHVSVRNYKDYNRRQD